MKLYAFQPRGHGELSFFVMAESEEQARAAVDVFIKAPQKLSEWDDETRLPNARGWGTDYYEMTVVDPGAIITNFNE